MVRAVLDALRAAGEPMPTQAVAAAVMAAWGVAPDGPNAVRVADSVGAALRRQERAGTVKGTRGPGGLVAWEIVR